MMPASALLQKHSTKANTPGRTLLCKKLQDARDKQKKQNTSPQMRSVATQIVTVQLKG